MNRNQSAMIPSNFPRYLLLLLAILWIWGCSNSPRYRAGTAPESRPERSAPPSLSRSATKKVFTGVASYYADDFHGKLTANGEVFDMYGLTAAHKTLPLNTIIRVTNLDNDKSVILRVNDRGPYVEGRILDCSYGAAVKLGFVGEGTARVKIEVIEYGDDEYMKHKDN